jgi:MFS family permease
MSSVPDRLFTPRFFMMCGFSFTVFLSAFQLFPTAPYRVLALGGGKFAAGLVLGFLTYASAFSAPVTGAIADRLGRRRTLLVASLVLAGFALLYGLVEHVWLLLVLVLVHGVFWSGLLSASAAYVTDLMPEHRRAEGIAYWGIASTLSVAVAPALGLWLFDRGWNWVCGSIGVLNLAMAAIAWRLPDDRRDSLHRPSLRETFRHGVVDWRVTMLAVTLFLYCFGFGGVMSFVALYTEASGVAPRALFFTVFSAVVILSRPFSGRFADQVGHVRVFVPCVLLAVLGYALLAVGGSRTMFALAAAVFGLGFGSAYPVFAAYVMQHVSPVRRASAFGSILAALDTGIGSGSIALGWIVQQYGFHAAFWTAASVAALAVPYFLAVRPVFVRLTDASATGAGPGR